MQDLLELWPGDTGLSPPGVPLQCLCRILDEMVEAAGLRREGRADSQMYEREHTIYSLTDWRHSPGKTPCLSRLLYAAWPSQ